MENIINTNIKNFLYVRKDVFMADYKELDQRYHTMKAALNLFAQRGGKTIVETGCQRQEEDWGGGMSTTLFGDFVSQYGGHLYTVDNDENHLDQAKKLTEHFNAYEDVITYTLEDSVQYLKQFTKTIDLLYLDSWDYPAHKLPDWDGTANYHMEHDKIVETFPDIIDGCQQHCVKELEAASTFLHKKSVILIDDNNFPGGGKARLAREWLFDNGWEVIIDHQQTLWSQH